MVTATPLYVLNTPTPLAVGAAPSLLILSANEAENTIDGQSLVWVPAGEFSMGLAKRRYGALDMAGNVYEWVNDWFHERYCEISPAITRPARRITKASTF